MVTRQFFRASVGICVLNDDSEVLALERYLAVDQLLPQRREEALLDRAASGAEHALTAALASFDAIYAIENVTPTTPTSRRP